MVTQTLKSRFTVLLFAAVAQWASFSFAAPIFSEKLLSNGLPSSSAFAQSRYQSSPNLDSFIDFEEDDALDQQGDGFHTIYVSNDGAVLGTFVNVPGAKIKVFANGEIQIAERDYTTEVDFHNDGRIQSIGDVDFYYYNSRSQIRSIGNIDFRYYNSGQLQEIDDLEFRYFNNGRVKSIDDVDFEYESSGIIETISNPQTNEGIEIVIVN